MTYLSPSDYDQYGLETATPEAWVAAASSLINAHCRRPTLMSASYTERKRLSSARNTVQLTYLPLVVVAPATRAITAVRARFANPRRGEFSDVRDFPGDVSLAFGLPGTWTNLDAAQCDYDASTGEVSLAANPIGLAYNEVEITYTAGLAAVPDEVKFACAQIVKNAQATPALNVRSGRVDSLQLDYFADSLVDDSVRKLLAPFVAVKLS